MPDIQSLAPEIILLVIVITVVLLVFTKSDAGATELKERYESAREKLPLVGDTCYRLDPSKLRVEASFDYKKYLEEGQKERFVFAANIDISDEFSGVQITGPLENQLSSNEIECERKGGQCNFNPDVNVEFDIAGIFITIDNVPKPIYDILNQEKSIEISAWKSIGIEKNRLYEVSLDRLIRQKADYYLARFKTERCRI